MKVGEFKFLSNKNIISIQNNIENKTGLYINTINALSKTYFRNS